MIYVSRRWSRRSRLVQLVLPILSCLVIVAQGGTTGRRGLLAAGRAAHVAESVQSPLAAQLPISNSSGRTGKEHSSEPKSSAGAAGQTHQAMSARPGSRRPADARLRKMIGRLLELAARDIALAKANTISDEISPTKTLSAAANEAEEQVLRAEQAGAAAIDAAEAAELQIDDDVPDEPNFRGSGVAPGSGSEDVDPGSSAAQANHSHRRKHMLGAIMKVMPGHVSLNGLHLIFVMLLVLASCIMNHPRKHSKAEVGFDERQHPLFYVFASRNMRGPHGHLFDM